MRSRRDTDSPWASRFYTDPFPRSENLIHWTNENYISTERYQSLSAFEIPVESDEFLSSKSGEALSHIYPTASLAASDPSKNGFRTLEYTPRTANELNSAPQPATVSFQPRNTIQSGKRRRPITHFERKAAVKTRLSRGCLRCRMKKVSVSPGLPYVILYLRF